MTVELKHLTKTNKTAFLGLHDNGFISDSDLERADQVAELLMEQSGHQHTLMAVMLAASRCAYTSEMINRSIRHKKDPDKHPRVKMRFDWTSRRFREEHERLERRENMTRTINQYKHCSFPNFRNKRLPTVFQEFLKSRNAVNALIESPARLAIEGNQLNHCVGGADYIEGCMRGMNCFISLVAAKKRWTIKLEQKGNSVGIGQCLGKNNNSPTDKELAAIHYRLASKEVQHAKFSGSVMFSLQELGITIPKNINELYNVRTIGEVPGITKYVMAEVKKQLLAGTFKWQEGTDRVYNVDSLAKV